MERLGLTSSEVSALSEVHAVLAKHGLDDKFGIRLNHAHFPMGEGEVMHETNDKESRVLTVVPKKAEELPAGAFASQWYFGSDGRLVVDQYCCDPPAPAH